MSNVPKKRYKGRVHHQVELARQVYGIPSFYGHRSVATYENALGSKKTVEGEPLLPTEDRLTCPDCHKFKTDHDWKACDTQGKLF